MTSDLDICNTRHIFYCDLSGRLVFLLLTNWLIDRMLVHVGLLYAYLGQPWAIYHLGQQRKSRSCVKFKVTVWERSSATVGLSQQNYAILSTRKIAIYLQVAIAWLNATKFSTMIQNGSLERIGSPPSWVFKIKFLTTRGPIFKTS